MEGTGKSDDCLGGKCRGEESEQTGDGRVMRGRQRIRRRIVPLALLGLMTVALASCGVKGNLEPPPDAPKATSTDTTTGKAPHRRFILDGLLE